jgi:hypothetical protein
LQDSKQNFLPQWEEPERAKEAVVGIDNMFIDIVEADAHNIRCVLCITTLLN